MASKFIKALMSGVGQAINKTKTNVPKTELGKKVRDLKISTQKNKASRAKLNQSIFEFKRNEKFTFPSNTKKTESNTESYKRITGENNKVIKNMLDKATENKKDGGRMGLKGGGNDMGSGLNQSINSLKRILDRIPEGQKRKSKIPKNNFKRDRSPMEVNRVISKMKSDAQAMGGNVRTAGEMSPLKGESTKSFKERTDAKVGGRMGRKFGSPNPRKSNVQKIKETFGSKKNVPSKLKGFSKLPEKVQQQMNNKLARKV